MPLALALHGAGDAGGGISHFIDLADEFGLVPLAPASRERTREAVEGPALAAGRAGSATPACVFCNTMASTRERGAGW
jgi:hypothetical protein